MLEEIVQQLRSEKWNTQKNKRKNKSCTPSFRRLTCTVSFFLGERETGSLAFSLFLTGFNGTARIRASPACWFDSWSHALRAQQLVTNKSRSSSSTSSSEMSGLIAPGRSTKPRSSQPRHVVIETCKKSSKRSRCSPSVMIPSTMYRTFGLEKFCMPRTAGPIFRLLY